MSLINELLNKANKDSKKKLNKEDQKAYVIALYENFKEKGMCDENLYYLVSGIKFGAINTFVNWNHSLKAEKQIENLNVLIKSKNVQSMDNSGKLRMFLMLLIAELNEVETNDNIVGELLHWLVDLSYKKDGTRLSDLGKIFKAYFVNGMKNGTKLPSLERYNLPKEYEIQLLKFFEDAISGVEPKGDEEIDKRNILRSWVRRELESKEKDIQLSVDKDEKISNPENVNKEKTVKEKKNKEDIHIKSSFGKRLLEMAKSMDEFDKMFRMSVEQCKKQEREISQLKTNNDNLEKLHAASVDENANLRKELNEVKRRYEECLLVNKELEERVSRQVSVIDVYDQDKANTKTELLNQIATALKKIYTDFKIAESMEMTIDLGENMRDSLDDVFRKLKKMGIDIEGR